MDALSKIDDTLPAGTIPRDYHENVFEIPRMSAIQKYLESVKPHIR